MDAVADPIAKALAVKTLNDFTAYLAGLAEHAEQHPEKIENPITAHFLEATSAWAEGMDDFCRMHGVELDQLNPWQVGAMLFAAGLIYE